MSEMISNKKFIARMSKLKLPKGFTAEMVTEDRGWKDSPIPTLVYVVKGEGVEVRFDQNGSGHTLFTIGETQYSFDRRGVEDSFYHLPLWKGDRTRYNVNTILKEQLERVEDQLAYAKTAIPVPCIPGHTTNPEGLVKLKASLKKNGYVSFMPSGFGIGYIVRVDPARGTKSAPKALADFFEVDRLFISTVECD